MYDLYNVITICPSPKNHKVCNGSEYSKVTFQEKKNKERKIFMFGQYMPIINRTPVHHIALLMNMLKPTLHFPIEDGKSVS